MALTALKVKRLGPGYHADGRGLYLQVTGSGARSWIFRYAMPGDFTNAEKKYRRSREMGLGSLADVSLHDAREAAEKWRKVKREGKDPIHVRQAKIAEEALARARGMTFKQAAEAYMASHNVAWRNEK